MVFPEVRFTHLATRWYRHVSSFHDTGSDSWHCRV